MVAQLARILIVDDEQDICELLFRLLERAGFLPILAHDGYTALEMIRRGMPDIVVSDVRMAGMDGMDLLRRAKQLDSNLPVIMITGWGGIDGAVEAVKHGAYDYLAKPLDGGQLVAKIKQALQDRGPGLGKRVICDPTQNEAISKLQQMMGPSVAVLRIISEVALVAPSNFAVIIQGETGTGKELIAGTIHKASLRSEAPIVPVDCGAIAETLFESELFGYEKGAFTGAGTPKPGKFEIAQRGTLFLDEISNMPMKSQVKLLRSIQEKSFFPIGGRKAVTVDVRLIVATNEDLNAAVCEGSFSRDLFYRLSEFTIGIPPLRERKEDILHIANNILQTTNTELSKTVRGFSESAVEALLDYTWPGNVRQLRSAIRRGVLLAEDWIALDHLGLDDCSNGDAGPAARDSDSLIESLPLKEMVRRSTIELEKHALTEALRRTGGNKAKAARLLQMDYTTIHAKIKHYRIKGGREN
ncbi:MAG: sigma-54-dependent transcriptional regulator [Desulfomonilaceae bacterium]